MRSTFLILLVWTVMGSSQVSAREIRLYPTAALEAYRTKGTNEYLLIVSHPGSCYSETTIGVPLIISGCQQFIDESLWFPTAQEAVDWVNEFAQINDCYYLNVDQTTERLCAESSTKKYHFQFLLKVADVPLAQVDQKVIEKQSKTVEVEVVRKRYVLK